MMPLSQKPASVRMIGPETSLAEAAKVMVQYQIGAILIREDADSPVQGILTDRDIVKAIAEGDDPVSATVAKFMGRRVEMLPAGATRREITEMMRAHGIRRIPLLGEDDEIVGIVSLDDLLFEMGAELFDLSRAVETELKGEAPWPDPDR